jgi:uncharacterized membrane protein
MASRASIAGHPIHPMLVTIPIGLLLFSFICDLCFRFGSGSSVWVTVAIYTMTGGVIGALIAAVPGLIDLLSLQPSKAKTIGVWHMVINLTVVALFAVNLCVLNNRARRATCPLSFRSWAFSCWSFQAGLAGRWSTCMAWPPHANARRK